MKTRKPIVLTVEEENFYKGFTPMTPSPKPEITIGSRVRIIGEHPHTGREGVVKGAIRLLGKPAIEVRFDDGEGAFVMDPKKHRLELLEARP